MKPIARDPRFWTKTSLIQIGYGVWANLTQVGIGLAYGFQAVTLRKLMAKDSLIEISSDEESWIAAVLTLSAPVGSLISGSVLDRRGRRVMLLVCQVPMFVGWFYTGFAVTASDIIIGRIITGIGCGMTIVPSRIYATEISLPNMRGVIGVFPDIAIAIGLSIQTVLGPVLLWSTSCYLYGLYAMILIMCNYFLPESPYYMLLKDNTSQVKQALSNFRSPSYDLESEMHDLIDFKEDNDIRRLNVLEKLRATIKKASCKPFGITTAYFIIAELSGVNIIMLWTIDILSLSKSSVDLHEGNLVLALTRLIVSVFMSMLLFKIGKKPLAVVSALGVGSVCIGLGVYMHYNKQPTIVPQLCYIAYIAFATLGYYTLPFLIMAEVYPLQNRGFLSGFSVSLVSYLMFATNKYFPYMKELLGFYNTVITFGASSLIGSLFLFFYLPETKLLTLSDIEEYYNSRRPTLVSQRRVMSLQLREASSSAVPQLNSSKSKTNVAKSSSEKLSKRKKHNIKKDHKKEQEKKSKEDQTKKSKPHLTLRTESDQEIADDTTDSSKEKNISK